MFRFVVILLFIWGCGTPKQAVAPTASMGTIPLTGTYPTDLVLHYKLYKSGLTDTVNNAVAAALKGPFGFSSYSIEVVLSKAGSANVELQGKSVLVIVPVQVQVTKKTFLTDFKAKGIMEMSFVSDIEIDSVWNLKTKTRLSDHRWKEKPVLTMAGFSIPIETVSDAIVTRSKLAIEQSIDESVRESFQLRTKMRETMALFAAPFTIDTPMQAWIHIKPERFQLNKITNGRQFATGKIGMTATSSFSTTKLAVPPAKSGLPKVTWTDKMADTSVFRLLADIRSDHVTKSLQTALIGQTFASEGKSITIQQVEVGFLPGSVTISVQTTGSFKGTIVISGTPQTGKNSGEITFPVRDIQVKTKNLLHKAAAWLGEGKIRSELEKKMRFSLRDMLAGAQQEVNAQLLEMKKKYDLDISVGLGSAQVESLELREGRLLALLQCRFYLGIGIRDFRSFGKF